MRKPDLAPGRSDTISFLLLMLIGAVGLYFGWRLFWFLTDDSFIEFRYVSNSRLGYGYVWNAPPFLPVEGYTSFLWVALLDLVWRVTGIEPPRSANVMSLVLAYAELVLAALMLIRIPWQPSLRKYRMGFLALFLVGVLLNPTFLTWTSSGLETALVNFLIILWVFVVLQTHARKRVIWASITAALLALTRPDGLAFCAATGAMIAVLAFQEPNRKAVWRLLLFGLLPFVAVGAHEAWRLSFYGALLPNTYYAKVVEPWPASGVRYLASFVLEYCVWFPVLTVIVLAAMRRAAPKSSKRAPKKPVSTYAIPAIAIAALAFHLGYYTFVVGGDHFEYRVYSYTIPLLYLAFAYALSRLTPRPPIVALLLLIFVLLSMPIPWTHWSRSKHFTTRKETLDLIIPLAPRSPQILAWYVKPWDRFQEWLIVRSACKRYQEHVVFWKFQIDRYPSREEGAEIPRDNFPVYAVGSVGMGVVVFPNVNIIDIIGLNDYIVARTPYPNKQRLMAHGRRGPDEYVQSYSPNVKENGSVAMRPRPLTAARIACLEGYWRVRLPEIQAGFRKFEDWRLCYE